MSNAELIRNLQEAMQSRSRPAPYDATAVVTRVDGTTAWVRLAGSDTETPIKRTIDAKAGDVVQVRVGGGSAWINGNQSAPPTDDRIAISADTKATEAKEEIRTVRQDLVVTNEVVAQKATIEELDAEKARINSLEVGKANVADLNAATGRIGQLEANALTADSATIKDLQANKANVSGLTAATGRIGQLEADHVSTADLEAVQADIDNLEATKADVAVLEADYAKIDLANVNTAQITNGVIQTAAIVDEQVFTVTGNKATIKEINADNINVRNLNAKNLKIETADGYITIGDKKTPTKEFIDSLTNELNDRIDGAIETFTATAVPTLSNYPASDWETAEERATHVGDVCYVVNDQIAQNGYCYRFTLNGSTFSWQLIKDSDVTAALQRLQTAEGKIGNIEAFDEDIATFKTETEGEISTLQTKTSTLETSLGDKVDKTTFNQVSQKVNENSASITTLETNVAKKADSSTVTTLSNTVNSVSQKANANEAAISDLTETVESKADGSTVSTLTQTVNSVKQTADGNSSTITSLTTTLGTNADGTTKAGDIVHRTSAVEQDLSGFKTTVASTYHKTSDFNTYKTANDSAVAAAKKAGTDAQSSLNSYKTTNDAAVANAKKAGDDAQADLDAYKGTVSETYATKSSVTQTADGIKQEVASTYTTQTTFNNYKSSNDSAVAGVKTTADAAKEAIDGLEIGGRNLAKGTDVRYTNLSGMMYGGKLLASAGIQEGDTITISVDVDADDIEWNTTASQNRIGCSINIPLASGQQYIEVWVGRAISESSNVVKAFTGSFHGRVYKTFVMRAAVTEDRDIYLYAQGIKSGTLSVGNVKFERGNRATDWTPAPEDLEAATTAVASDLETVKTTYVKNSTFETTTEQIRGEVSAVETTAKNYTDGKIATEVSDRNSAITQKADEITSSVSATYATKTSVPTKVSQLTNDSNYATTMQAQGYANTAESNAKADTAEKLKSYSTTAQVTSAINQKAGEITQTVSETYQTKADMDDYSTTTEMNSAIDQKADSITTSVSNTYATKSSLKTTSDNLAGYITSNNAALKTMQDQIDGAIETWFYAVDPTTSNAPAKDWGTTDLKNQHLGDLYYNTATGHVFRWQLSGSTYSWAEIEDTDARKALADAAAAQATANSKRRVFVAQPTAPYEVGDLWVQGASGDIMRCSTARASGSYTESDWVKASKYTDDTALNSFKTTYNTKMEQTDQAIALKANASEVYTKSQTDGLISTEVTNRNAAITAASDSITASVAETYTTKTDFNALEIGGRNLFKNSKLGTPWVLDTGASRYDADTVQIVAGSSGLRRVYQLPSQGYWGRWEANTTYTLSVDAKASADGLRLSMQPQANGVQYKYVDVTTEWKRYSYTFTSGNATATASLTLLCAGSSGTLYLRKPKLEYGNKATDWTPAPEDLEAYADSAVATAKSEIKVTTDGISTEVAKKVGNSEIISKINQSAETVKIQASKVEVDGTVIIGKSTAESVAKTAVDGLQVGGRNLAKDTNVSFTWTSADGNTHLSGTFCGNLLSGTVITVSAQIDAENVTWAASGARRIGCETSIAKTGGGRQYIGVWAGQQVSDGANVVKAFTGSFHGRVSKTFTLAGDWKASDNTPIICYAQNFYGTVSVSNIKIEIGSKATDWSPAPEDVDAGIASASQTASKYITADSTSGIKVHAEANPTTNYAQIDDTGMSIYQGVDGVATEVAEFKASGARIGQNDKANVNVTPNSVEINAYTGSNAVTITCESVTDYTGEIDYGIKITDEHNQSAIRILPTLIEDEAFDGTLELQSLMARYAFDCNGGMYMYCGEGGFSVGGPTKEFFCVDEGGQITVNYQQPPILYEDVTEIVSYSAGTIGTKGASVSLGTTVKTGYTYIGAVVLRHQNAGNFWISFSRNTSNNNVYADCYRANASAVQGMAITVRKMWASTKITGIPK